jgi:hypothetical protein
MVTGAGFVTVPVPVGVTVTVYVRVAGATGVEVPPLPQAMENPARVMAAAVSRTAITCLRRAANGALSRTAPSMIVPPLDHGATGEWFVAFALELIVRTVFPLPPLVRMTDGALAETFEAVPSSELTVATNETVPA